MVEEGGGGLSLPVLFFDGEREMNIGNVEINPTLEYKPFQLMLSQKIGISPNQISIYLVDKGRNHRTLFSEDRRRIPITGKVNFGLICRQKDCCFLVVLKRSRKSRNRRERTMNGVDTAGFFSLSEFSMPPEMRPVQENLVLLRRNKQVPFCDHIKQSDLSDSNGRLQSLRIQREHYQTATGKRNLHSLCFMASGGYETDSIPYWRPVTPPEAVMRTNNGKRRVFCEECEKWGRKGTSMPFHPCVKDTVITGFTISRLGPIDRPNNKAFPSFPWR